MKNRIRIARGTKAQINDSNTNIPVNNGKVAAGVPIYTTDENKLYISDGTQKPSDLLGINASGAEKLININNGVVTNQSTTDGKLMYIDSNDGKAKDSSLSIGGTTGTAPNQTTYPVYLNNGEIKVLNSKLSNDISGNADSATNALNSVVQEFIFDDQVTDIQLSSNIRNSKIYLYFDNKGSGSNQTFIEINNGNDGRVWYDSSTNNVYFSGIFCKNETDSTASPLTLISPLGLNLEIIIPNDKDYIVSTLNLGGTTVGTYWIKSFKQLNILALQNLTYKQLNNNCNSLIVDEYTLSKRINIFHNTIGFSSNDRQIGGDPVYGTDKIILNEGDVVEIHYAFGSSTRGANPNTFKNIIKAKLTADPYSTYTKEYNGHTYRGYYTNPILLTQLRTSTAGATSSNTGYFTLNQGNIKFSLGFWDFQLWINLGISVDFSTQTSTPSTHSLTISTPYITIFDIYKIVE